MRSGKSQEDGWRGFSWRPATLASIRRRIDRHREPLAQALGLDDTTEIDAAVEDVTTLLIRCAVFLREVDKAASPARQRIILRRFREGGQFTGSALWRLDGATFNLIAKHYPRGTIALNTDPIDPQELRIAVETAIEDQVRQCRKWIENEGHTPCEVYSDHAISGASTLRPGYQKMLEDARNGAFDIVIAEALDRFSRDQEDIAGLYKRLSFAGIKLSPCPRARSTNSTSALRAP